MAKHKQRALRPQAMIALLAALSLALTVAGCTGPAAGGGARGGAGNGAALVVEGAWARPAAPGMHGMGATSAAYFTIRNTGGEDDALIGAGTGIAGLVEIHETFDSGDGMAMRPARRVPLPSGESVEFRPGGLHVMLMELNGDLSVGDRFPLTLEFEKDGAQTVEVVVREP